MIREPAFESACLFNGHDDLVWSIYADWLAERGEAERASAYRLPPKDNLDRVHRWLRLSRRVWRPIKPAKFEVAPAFYDLLKEYVLMQHDVLGASVALVDDPPEYRVRGVAITAKGRRKPYRRTLTAHPQSLVQAALEALEALGEVRLTDLASDLQRMVAARELIREDRMGFGVGASVDGQPWKNAFIPFGIDRRELSLNRRPDTIVDLIQARRNAAAVALLEFLNNDYLANHDEAELSRYQIVGLRGEWFRQDVVEQVPGQPGVIACYLSAVYAFRRRRLAPTYTHPAHRLPPGANAQNERLTLT